MQERINIKNGQRLSALGFGCMRLPTKVGGGFDEPRAVSMIRDAVDNGINYYDTAYIYNGGQNEVLLGKALAGGYRERVYIATKLPAYMVQKLSGAQSMFATELKRLKTDYIDYYLLHMLTDINSFDRMVEIGVLQWMEELKSAGTIRNIGFSFHGSHDSFRKILEAYPWDFCQIQYNYMDENHQAGKEGLLLAAKMGIPVIVMEPIRGGMLSDQLPDSITRAFRETNPGRSMAEWALRWVWNHGEVTVVLSGMSTEAQLFENIKTASDALPNSLTDADLAVFERVKADMAAQTRIPCTACGYCMPCPFGVDIPGCFSIYNEKYLVNGSGGFFNYYRTLGVFSVRPGFASMCTECGRCESHCPQSIEIRKELKLVRRTFERPISRSVIRLMRGFLRIEKRRKGGGS
jgi:predicted aldo/keto reductase-like oxidoreductase